MAHFARIEENTVWEIIVVTNDSISDSPFPESELLGQTMLTDSGFAGDWLQCSYSGSFRGAFPGTGWTWKPNSRRKDGGTFEPPAIPEPANAAK